jgi:predicted nucleic acid-binding protein
LVSAVRLDNPKLMLWRELQQHGTRRFKRATSLGLSLSELLLGIASLPAGKRRSALAEQIISLFAERIVPFDIAGAEAYAEIVTRARRHGHSIAVADAQIAAIAASRRFSVATRDEAPFRAAGIKVINPWTVAPGAD